MLYVVVVQGLLVSRFAIIITVYFLLFISLHPYILVRSLVLLEYAYDSTRVYSIRSYVYLIFIYNIYTRE